jgi:NADH-quinone oxidoreductase subunit M
MESQFPILTILIFLPTVAAVACAFMSRSRPRAMMALGIGASALVFALSLSLVFVFEPGHSGMQLVERASWIPKIGASYKIGVDGLSVLLVLLTTFLTPLALLSSWNAIRERVKEYVIAMLVLETGMIGVFLALDLFLFYVFWEVMLVPMYFIIGIWGGPRKVYAAIKFVLFTLAGSLLMLVAILVLYFMHAAQTGVSTFDLQEIYNTTIPLRPQMLLFGAFFLAFAIKVPLFPLHTWLPDAHVEAPTAGSVILAGVLLKMGTYGLLRFCLPLFPQAARELTPLVIALAVIGIVYGALVSMVQKDIKSLVAYSSVSHLGFVVLGIFIANIQSVEGSIIQMVNHGLSTGALFLIVGMIYERRHTRLIDEFGGLATKIPVFTVFFLIVMLSSIGLPGLNGFVGEFLILTGTFRENVPMAAVAATGVILAAGYMLWMYRRVMHGKITNPENEKLIDLSFRERFILVPLVLVIFAIGVFPRTFLVRTEASVVKLLTEYREAAGMEGLPRVAPVRGGGAGHDQGLLLEPEDVDPIGVTAGVDISHDVPAAGDELSPDGLVALAGARRDDATGESAGGVTGESSGAAEGARHDAEPDGTAPGRGRDEAWRDSAPDGDNDAER